ncbi:hypothetical protein [Bosea sp. (in: a-proteobacteria)]|uniref:hypothetical protein n=1 Tax=Bosea sp. (in: a-proteobacteria) TaxID=1871050 RepID=UPI003F71271A
MPKSTKTGQPEALATFAAAARNKGKKPASVGLKATAETAAKPASSAKKQDAATRVLQEGVTGKDRKADKAIDALPDRTKPGRKR